MTSPRTEFPSSPPRCNPPSLDKQPNQAIDSLRSDPPPEYFPTSNDTPNQSWRGGIVGDIFGPSGLGESGEVGSHNTTLTKRKSKVRDNPSKAGSEHVEQNNRDDHERDIEDHGPTMSDDSSQPDNHQLPHPWIDEIHTPGLKARLSILPFEQPSNTNTTDNNAAFPLSLPRPPEPFQSPCPTPKAPQPKRHFSPSPTASPPSSPSSSIPETRPTALPSSILLELRANIRGLISDYFILRGTFPQILDPQQLLRRENFGPRGENGAGEWLTKLEISIDKLCDAALTRESAGSHGTGDGINTGRSAGSESRKARKLVLQEQTFKVARAGYESMRAKLDAIRESLEAKNGQGGVWQYKPDIPFEILGSASRLQNLEKGDDSDDGDDGEDLEIEPTPNARVMGKLKLLKIFSTTAISGKKPVKRKNHSLFFDTNGAGVENESDDATGFAPISKRQRVDNNRTNITTKTGNFTFSNNPERRESRTKEPAPELATTLPHISIPNTKQQTRYDSGSEDSDSVSDKPAASRNKKKRVPRWREEVTFPNLSLARSHARSEKSVGASSHHEAGSGIIHVGENSRGSEVMLGSGVADLIRENSERMSDLAFPPTTGTTRVGKSVPSEVELARVIEYSDLRVGYEPEREKSALLQLAEYAIASGGIGESGMPNDEGQQGKLSEREPERQWEPSKGKKRKGDDSDDDANGGATEGASGGETSRALKIRKIRS